MLLSWPNFPCQYASNSTNIFGIAHVTPKKENANDQALLPTNNEELRELG